MRVRTQTRKTVVTKARETNVEQIYTQVSNNSPPNRTGNAKLTKRNRRTAVSSGPRFCVEAMLEIWFTPVLCRTRAKKAIIYPQYPKPWVSTATSQRGLQLSESRFNGRAVQGGKRPIASALRHTGIDTPPAHGIGSSNTLHADPTLKRCQRD